MSRIDERTRVDEVGGIDRRQALAWCGTAATFAFTKAHASPVNAMGGEALYDDVRAYDALGEHRTATPGDTATSRWLEHRMRSAGLTTTLQPFAAPLFEPERCLIEVAGAATGAFPAWPVVPTGAAGLDGVLALADGGAVAGKIAVVRMPYGPGASWAAPRAGAPVQAAIDQGAIAAILVTEGPTGEVIALNTEPGRFEWKVPVLIAPGRTGETLAAAAAGGAKARMVSIGHMNPAAVATNVIGRRPGPGKSIVVTTPKSGWFRCAGERGTGIAVFLAAADWLVRHTAADLVFAATSAHEHGYGGGAEFVRVAPKIDDVRVWLHLGANVGCQAVTIAEGRVTGSGAAMPRGTAANDELIPVVQKAFAGVEGYETCRPLTAANAAGELEMFHEAGYRALIGLLGGNTLFHTPLDRADVATTPAILEPVARRCCDLLASLA